MKGPLVAAGVLLLLVGIGCAGLGRHDGLESVEVVSSERVRRAWLHEPGVWHTGPRPLVIVMHGGGTARRDEALTLANAWRPHFDEGHVLAFPVSAYEGGLVEGTSLRYARTWTQWDDEERIRGTDLIFLRDLIEIVADRIELDRQRIYLAGFSTGGAFTWFAACFDPKPYAGFGVVGMPISPALAEQCDPVVKRPLVFIHGSHDTWFPTGEDATPWADTRRWLTDHRRCGRYPVAQPWVEGEHGVLASGSRHDCRTVPSVEAWRVDGIGHCWPGAPGCRGVDAVPLLFDYWRRTTGL